MADRTGTVVAWNPAAAELLGRSESEALGRPLADLLPWPERTWAMEPGDGIRGAAGKGGWHPLTVRGGDGAARQFEVLQVLPGAPDGPGFVVLHLRTDAVRGGGGEPDGHRDRLARVTAQLEVAEARRLQSEELFRCAFRSSPVALSVVSLETGQLVEANDTFLEWVGHPREAVIGRTTRELQLWTDPSARDGFLHDIARDGFIRNRECRFTLRPGVVSTLLVLAELIRFHGAPHVLAASQNIDALKRAEADLRRALVQEQELRRLKSGFVSLVSHEYRRPLGVIQSSAEILDTYFDRLDPDRRRLHLADIRDSAATMTRLMDEVLFLERSESGRLGCRPAPVALADFCRDLLASPGFGEQAARIRLECPSGLPPAWLDSGLLRLALGNLLGNALKYSPPDRPVTLTVGRRDDVAVLTVTDRGIGIPEADRERLFEPFHRARNVGDIPGSGLGLVIVRKGAELHGGRVSVESREGEGTSVALHLPVFRTALTP